MPGIKTKMQTSTPTQTNLINYCRPDVVQNFSHWLSYTFPSNAAALLNKDTVIQEKDSQKSRADNFARYGRNITLIIDEQGHEIFTPDNTPCATLLLKTLKSNATIIVASTLTFKRLLMSFSPKPSLLAAWDVYCTHSNDLIFIPKWMRATPWHKNDDLGIDLRECYPCTEPLSMQIETPSSIAFFVSLLTSKHALLKTFKKLILDKKTDGLATMLPWTVYAMGHGSYNGIHHNICGWSAYYFNDFLEHLQTIDIKGLIQDSCHAASKRILIDLYGNRTFNFPIIGYGLFDAPTYSKNSRLNVDYKAFFKALHDIHSFDDDTAVLIDQALFLTAPLYAANTSRIRAAGQPHFKLNISTANAFTPDNMPLPRNPNLPVFFYLNVPVVEKPITLDFKQISISSVLPGQINHSIKTIESPALKDPKEVFDAFMQLQSLDKRIYLIEHLKGFETLEMINIIIFHNYAPMFAPEIVSNYFHNYFMYYQMNGKHYLATLKDPFKLYKNPNNAELQSVKITEISAYQAQDYINFFARIKKDLVANPGYNPEKNNLGDTIAIAHPAIGSSIFISKSLAIWAIHLTFTRMFIRS